MKKIQYNELLKRLAAHKIDPIYLILGKESYLEQQIQEAFQMLVPEEEREMNIGNYDMEVTPLGAVLNDATSAPFFGERRVIFVRNPYFLTGERHKGGPNHDIDGLQTYLDHPVETSVLVFLANYEKLDGRKKIVKTLNKQALTTQIGNLNQGQVSQLITTRLAEKQYTISSEAMNQLLFRTDSDLSTMMNELPKLMLYNVKERKITVESVNALVSKSLDQNVFDLSNAVLQKNSKQAIDIYQSLITQQEQPLRINAVLVSQFRLLLQVKILQNQGSSQGDIAGTLKVHPYRVKLAMQTSRRFSMKDLTMGYTGLVDLDLQLKSTQKDPELLFELFLLQFIDQKIA
ncbi:DNA polymerase III delta subunit [Pediococcus damnosus]|uniref:DNA polymerase III subunit delta n=1 Tax=Pediococcus damnosus TaxID=51663 RepID=A0A0R2HAJ6_9LACO|nr:DNA polymerase III subunit delta [Pediococcus damnosus]AMV59803.1 DNA polymerase III delta subunit [Pediococcus damnosus]AMV61905.1 DNA polymerase III delta subunit [Pediococcus damnosus]AMV64049.1 DNA polymerase III delta subunit [Pediococcus damnosus]AMV66221.1 DNA polymerase III delta subunit [Pediococcus damnosus]AMV68500.1 DNA polymerase III delta subunit [Pediococcus damnosus]